MLNKYFKVVIAISAAIVLFIAPTAFADKIKITVVTHGQDASAFWSVAKKGVDDAGARYADVADVTYRNPKQFDMVEMSQLIDNACAGKPDGHAHRASVRAGGESGAPLRRPQPRVHGQKHGPREGGGPVPPDPRALQWNGDGHRTVARRSRSHRRPHHAR